MNAEGKAGTLKRELNKTRISIQVLGSLRTVTKLSVLLPDPDSMLKEIIKW